jgi:hypothetical protein
MAAMGLSQARKLVEAGRAIRVLLLSDPEELRGDAATMYQSLLGKLQPLNVASVIVREPSGLDSPGAAEVFSADVIVDAILGTGFRPPVSPLYRAAILKMNAASAPIVAVDIPSGADADSTRPSQTHDAGRAGEQARAACRRDLYRAASSPRFAALTKGPIVVAPIGSPPEASGLETRASSEHSRRFSGAPRASRTRRATRVAMATWWLSADRLAKPARRRCRDSRRFARVPAFRQWPRLNPYSEPSPVFIPN